jgi:hypothetical protein
MKKEDIYIWYSPATDITGSKLQEALGISGGRIKPPASKKLVIGWGAKTKDKVVFNAGVKVLNHPDDIKLNRNKLEASKKLAEALNVDGTTKVARIATADSIKQDLEEGKLSMPVIGRKKYHQGGKGFWDCPTVAQLNAALEDGAQYFQEMIAVKDEYRMHVFNGEVIHAVKKVRRTDEEFQEAWIEDGLEQQRVLAEKNNNPFDEDMIRRVLRRQAKSACAGGVNMVLRSNKLGWKFSIVKKYDSKLADLAVAAAKALDLTFGAVDCCLDVNGNPFVFEVNSGPGLEGTSFDKYVEAFTGIIEAKPAPKAKAPSAGAVKKTTAVAAEAGALSRKTLLKEQLDRLTRLVEESSEEEMEMVQKLGAKLIFGTSDD